MLFPCLGRTISRKTLPEVLNVWTEPLRQGPPAREITSISLTQEKVLVALFDLFPKQIQVMLKL